MRGIRRQDPSVAGTLERKRESWMDEGYGMKEWNGMEHLNEAYSD